MLHNSKCFSRVCSIRFWLAMQMARLVMVQCSVQGDPDDGEQDQASGSDGKRPEEDYFPGRQVWTETNSRTFKLTRLNARASLWGYCRCLNLGPIQHYET
jgi:hypothetical protein